VLSAKQKIAVTALVLVALAALVSGVLLIRDALASSGGGSHRTEFSVGLILILAVAFLALSAQSWWKRRRS
jgi:hypothetical protein